MKLRYKVLSGIALVILFSLAALALTLGHQSACPAEPTAVSAEGHMQAIAYHCYGSPDVLELANVVKPVPADNEVLIKVRAASINPLDWHYMRGSPFFMRLDSGIGAPTDPRMGVDFAGTIESVGPSVSQFKPGDEVFGGANGAFSEYLVIREDRALALKPRNVSFQQAAAVPIAGLSALQALRDEGKISPGKRVLINGASGGVGTFAVQIAKSYGAEVTGVCSTRNVDLVRSLGADHVIDYSKQDFTEGGTKYDLIIDNVGNHSPLAISNVLEPDGILVMVGGPGGNWVGPLIRPLQSLIIAPFVEQEMKLLMAKMQADDLTVLADMMATGKLTPVIDRRYPLAEVPAAIRYSEEGRARGKIVVDVE